MLLIKDTFFHTSKRSPVHFSSRVRPNLLEFSSLNSCKILFSYDEKCGEIRYTGVKFFTNNSALQLILIMLEK